MLIIVNYTPVRLRAEFVTTYSFETFSGTSLSASGNLCGEAGRGILSIGGGEYVLSLDAWNEAGVAGQALVANFVGRPIDPSLGRLALVTNHQAMLGELISIVDAGRALHNVT